MGTSFILQEITQSSFFATLTTAVQEQMARYGRLEYFDEGSPLFLQGHPANHMFLIISGRIALTQSGEDGNQTILRFLGSGDVFAGLAVLPEAIYPATAQAMERSGAILWEHDYVNQLAQKEGCFSYALLQTVFARLEEAQLRLREMAYERTERRLALTLTRMVRQMGVESEAGIRIDLKLTRQMLAEMAGTTLFTASRILSGWEKDKIIQSSTGSLVILQPQRLMGMAYDLIQPETLEG